MDGPFRETTVKRKHNFNYVEFLEYQLSSDRDKQDTAFKG